MSTGNVVREIGWHEDIYACGSAYTYYTQKVWNGTNYAPGEPEGTPHPYGMTHTYLDRGACMKKVSGIWRPALTQVCIGGPSKHAIAWSASDENKLLGKLAENIRNHDFHGGNALGTAGQTAGLIADRAQRIAAGIRALKSGNAPKAIAQALGTGKPNPRKSPKKLTDQEMTSRWLEASYGWMPLLQDVHGAAEALGALESQALKRRFTARHAIKHKYASNPGPSIIAKYNSEYEISVKLVYTLTEELNPLDSLSLTNPAEIVWELLPWSFAIDWFLPIGQWINNKTLFTRLKGSWVRSTRTRWRGQSWSNRPDVILVQRPCTHRIFELARTVGVGGLRVPFPSLKSPFSPAWMRAANQIALLGELAKRGSK